MNAAMKNNVATLTTDLVRLAKNPQRDERVARPALDDQQRGQQGGAGGERQQDRRGAPGVLGGLQQPVDDGDESRGRGDRAGDVEPVVRLPHHAALGDQAGQHRQHDQGDRQVDEKIQPPGREVGYIISGFLTDLASWRWIFFINLPVALAVLVVLPRMVAESRMTRARDQRLDVVGAVTLTAGLVAIVYGLLRAAEHPWGSAGVVVPLVAGAALLATMLVVERRAGNPLIPLRFFANRTRSVVNLVTLFFMAAFISYTFMLTLFMQHVLGYSPLAGGLAWLPMGISIGAGIGISTALTPRLGVKAVSAAGFVGAGIGLLLTAVDAGSSYAGGILPGMVVFGLFAGLTMPATINAALHGVTAQDAGLASGVQGTMQQVGGALGLAVLVTLALRHTGAAAGPDALTEGYAFAFRIGAALMVTGGLLIAVLFERVGTALRDPTAEALQAA